MKIAKVTPVFKEGDSADLSNYRPISVLPCFSKIPERLMYNRLCKHLSNSKILYPKQFGLQKGHWNDHALLQLVDQICESFERNKYTIGVFIDLSKVFDTVDHNILLKKVENCEMRCSTRIHFRTSPFSSVYQRSSVHFRSSWPSYVCWQHKFVLLKHGYKYCFSQSKRWITKIQWMVHF